jgi:hypothetical protein
MNSLDMPSLCGQWWAKLFQTRTEKTFMVNDNRKLLVIYTLSREHETAEELDLKQLDSAPSRTRV